MGFFRRKQLGNAEIQNLYATILGDEQVFRFQVAMDDMFFVRGHQALYDLQGIICDLANGKSTIEEPLTQGLAFQQLGDDIRGASVHADVINRDYVGMVKSSGSAGFLLKAAEPILVIGSSWANYLQGDVTRQPVVTSAEHFAHAAVADFFENPIMPEGLADHRDGARTFVVAC